MAAFVTSKKSWLVRHFLLRFGPAGDIWRPSRQPGTESQRKWAMALVFHVRLIWAVVNGSLSDTAGCCMRAAGDPKLDCSAHDTRSAKRGTAAVLYDY